ncbi:MAG: GNAT family N-acetyltransferase [Anaerolineae bacterium]
MKPGKSVLQPDLQLKEVETRHELLEFITFPWRVYQDDPYWVPPLISERKAFLDPQKNPFFVHAEVALFLARRNGETVGTIAAIINDNHNTFHEEKAGFFGLFEVLDDYAVAEQLLARARDWVRGRGMEVIRGPMNMSTNDECGLLIDGFDSSPVVLMTYNPRYYVDFIERFGFVKAMDLYAYTLDTAVYERRADKLPAKLLRVAEMVRKKQKIHIRKVDFSHFDEEVARVKEVYNSAWEKNWGFVPLTDAEIDRLAANLKQFLDQDMVFFAEIEGRPVGFSLPLPDVNQPLRLAYPRPGEPELWTLLKLVWHWKIRRRIDTLRIFALGVIEEYRGQGVDALLYVETARKAFEKGYVRAEMSWILENNVMMRRAIERLGGTIYKTYRIYEMPL